MTSKNSKFKKAEQGSPPNMNQSENKNKSIIKQLFKIETPTLKKGQTPQQVAAQSQNYNEHNQAATISRSSEDEDSNQVLDAGHLRKLILQDQPNESDLRNKSMQDFNRYVKRLQEKQKAEQLYEKHKFSLQKYYIKLKKAEQEVKNIFEEARSRGISVDGCDSVGTLTSQDQQSQENLKLVRANITSDPRKRTARHKSGDLLAVPKPELQTSQKLTLLKNLTENKSENLSCSGRKFTKQQLLKNQENNEMQTDLRSVSVANDYSDQDNSDQISSQSTLWPLVPTIRKQVNHKQNTNRKNHLVNSYISQIQPQHRKQPYNKETSFAEKAQRILQLMQKVQTRVKVDDVNKGIGKLDLERRLSKHFKANKIQPQKDMEAQDNCGHLVLSPKGQKSKTMKDQHKLHLSLPEKLLLRHNVFGQAESSTQLEQNSSAVFVAQQGDEQEKQSNTLNLLSEQDKAEIQRDSSSPPQGQRLLMGPSNIGNHSIISRLTSLSDLIANKGNSSQSIDITVRQDPNTAREQRQSGRPKNHLQIKNHHRHSGSMRNDLLTPAFVDIMGQSESLKHPRQNENRQDFQQPQPRSSLHNSLAGKMSGKVGMSSKLQEKKRFEDELNKRLLSSSKSLTQLEDSIQSNYGVRQTCSFGQRNNPQVDSSKNGSESSQRKNKLDLRKVIAGVNQVQQQIQSLANALYTLVDNDQENTLSGAGDLLTVNNDQSDTADKKYTQENAIQAINQIEKILHQSMSGVSARSDESQKKVLYIQAIVRQLQEGSIDLGQVRSESKQHSSIHNISNNHESIQIQQQVLDQTQNQEIMDCEEGVSSRSTDGDNRIKELDTHHNFNLNQESINIIKSNQFMPPSQRPSQDKKVPYKSKQQFQRDMDEYLLDTQPFNSSHKSTPKAGNFRLGDPIGEKSNSKLNNSLIFNKRNNIEISPLRLKNPGQMSKNSQRPNQVKQINQSTRMFGSSSHNTPLSSMSDADKNSDKHDQQQNRHEASITPQQQNQQHQQQQQQQQTPYNYLPGFNQNQIQNVIQNPIQIFLQHPNAVNDLINQPIQIQQQQQQPQPNQSRHIQSLQSQQILKVVDAKKTTNKRTKKLKQKQQQPYTRMKTRQQKSRSPEITVKPKKAEKKTTQQTQNQQKEHKPSRRCKRAPYNTQKRRNKCESFQELVSQKRLKIEQVLKVEKCPDNKKIFHIKKCKYPYYKQTIDCLQLY